MKKHLMLFSLLIFVASCNEKPPEETYKYNVYLYNKNNEKLYSGTVVGLSSCRYIAKNRIRGNKNPGWDYFCCRQDGKNQCLEKAK